ncbi:MAG: cation transporter [Chloroflexota bacterium]|nr:cation transporter [Chloroflexota bacterium]
MSKVILDVPEISCEHCSQAIAKALQPQAGVQSVQVDVPTQKVRLEYDERAISLDQIKKILAEEEYPVEAVTVA